MSRWSPIFALAVVTLWMTLAPLPALAEPDPGRATTISLGATLAPCALGAVAFASDQPEIGWVLTSGGIILGPAAGFLYGDLAGRGFLGAGIRTGAGVIGLAAFDVLWDDTDNVGAAGLVLGSAVVIASAAIYDLVLVGSEVREHQRRKPVTLLPWRSPEGAPGLALRVAF